MTRYSILLLFALLLGACSRAVGKADVPGVYVFESKELRQRITVGRNDEYLNELYADGVLSWAETGTWAFEQEGGKNGISFSMFRFGLRDLSSTRGYWFVVPEKTITGRRRLCFDTDLDRCFEAVER